MELVTDDGLATADSGWGDWVGVAVCSGGPRVGTLALQSACLAAFRETTLRTAGIYACRVVGGGETLSVHADGRAVDLMVGDGGQVLGDELLRCLITSPGSFGLQRIIWNRQTYDGRTPAGRPYTGPNPHTDHLHIEQTPAGAASLTYLSALAALILLLPDIEGGGPMLLVGRLAEPTDTAWWLLIDGNMVYLHNWTNVQALIDAGVPQVRLPDAVRAHWPELR